MPADASQKIVPDLPAKPDPFLGGELWVGDKPGDWFDVVVTDRDEWSSKFSDEDDPVVVGTGSTQAGEDDEIKVVGRRAHLKQLIERHDPQPGDRFVGKYFGQPDGQRAHAYAARCRKGAGDEPPF